MRLVHFENHPSDPKLNEAFTKNLLEQIVREMTPTSIAWSITEKRILCTTIPCTCCPQVAMLVEINCFGSSLRAEDHQPVCGLYKVFAEIEDDSSISVRVEKLNPQIVMETILRV